MTVAALILGSLVAGAVLVAIIVALLVKNAQRHARRHGYASLGAYLRAAPRSDEEKRDAVNLALMGVVLCILGLLFPPFILIGVFPLFYGARKVAWTEMGLGLVDDTDQTTP